MFLVPLLLVSFVISSFWTFWSI